MTISLRSVIQKMSPERQQLLKHRVAELIAEDPELQALLTKTSDTEDHVRDEISRAENLERTRN